MRALLELTLRHKRLVLHFIRSHLVDAAASYEIMPTAFGESVQLHRYRDPKETAAFLGSLDAIVSSKLHLGVVALSYGVPFLSFSGKGKTRAFMRSIGAEHAVFAVAQERSVVRTLEDMLVGRMSPKALIGSASVAARESLGHLERLVERRGDRPQLAVVSGRQRMGETFLLEALAREGSTSERPSLRCCAVPDARSSASPLLSR